MQFEEASKFLLSYQVNTSDLHFRFPKMEIYILRNRSISWFNGISQVLSVHLVVGFWALLKEGHQG